VTDHGATGAEELQRELAGLRIAERRAEERLQRLAAVALALLGAETVEDLTAIVIGRGLPVLGADGGAVVVRDEQARVVRLAVSHELGEDVQVAFGEQPWDSPLPGAWAAVHGRELLLPNQTAGLAWAPETARVFAATQRYAWAALPLRVGDRLLGSLVASWVQEREFAADEVELLRAFAALCAQALDRIQHLEAQREAVRAVQRLAEGLQRALLTQPATPDALEIAVRYQPAAQQAQVGGDWYDAFITEAGATLLAVGDVSGHDTEAAAAMGQLRSLLRGLAFDSDDGPARLLTRLDRAMRGLEVDTLATVVLARVEEDADGTRWLRWSAAGHPPPLLRQPDGRVEVLDSADLLLGLDPESPRSEQRVRLPPGSVLLLYTDGLVERRGSDLDAGVGRLVEVLGAELDRSAEELCDAVVAAMTDLANDDDIAVLVLRTAA
jgi:serine phosphatase RsbU (regulator of sigma subunit)